MIRRGFLRGAAVAGGVGLAGCLERLGFEEQSAWEDPPLVEDRPEAVYLPASTEEMGTYGTATDGEYAVELSFTFPHRFWLVAGETERVDVGVDDSLHLMCSVWDVETETVLPTDVGLELDHEGETVVRNNPWPMLSQRMGFHYGDNVELPGEGEYTARIRVGPLDVGRRTGAFEGRLDSSTTLEIDFEYSHADLHDLEFDLIDEDRRGSRDAFELMDHGDHADHGHEHDEDGHDHGDGHGDHDHDVGHPPTSAGIPIEDLPGELLGDGSSGDAAVSILETDLERLADDDGSYLAVALRTPYNDVILPFASLRASIERDGETVLEESLVETLDHEFGHHYGIPVDDLETGDAVTVSVDSAPLVSRHDGYETAFFEFEDVAVEV